MSVLPHNQSKQAAPFGRRTGLAAGLCLRRYGAAICERLTTKGGLRHWEEERDDQGEVNDAGLVLEVADLPKPSLSQV